MWQRLCDHCTSTVDFIAVWGESRLSYGHFEKSAKAFVEVCNISVVLTVFTPYFPAFYFDITTYSIFLLSFLFWLILFKPYCFADTFFFFFNLVKHFASPLCETCFYKWNLFCSLAPLGVLQATAAPHHSAGSVFKETLDANRSGRSGPNNLASNITSSESNCAIDNGPPATSPCALVHLVCGVTWREHVRSHSACDGHNCQGSRCGRRWKWPAS